MTAILFNTASRKSIVGQVLQDNLKQIELAYYDKHDRRKVKKFDKREWIVII